MRDCLENLINEKSLNIKNELSMYGMSESKMVIIETVIYTKHEAELKVHNILPFITDCYREFKIEYGYMTGREYINHYNEE